jgi:diguanylate cyclase (GGDEF)-like protein/PAS domain S-box-containing protein
MKTKLAFFMTVATLALLTLLCGVEVRLLMKDVLRNLGAYQADIVESAALELDEKIELRKGAVLSAASMLSPRTAAGTPTAVEFRRYMGDRPGLNALFDATFVAGADGVPILEPQPSSQQPAARSIADQPYFRQALAGKSAVSSPLVDKATQRPSIVFAAPLRDGVGQVVGVLGGILYLDGSNFLATLGERRIGQAGYLVLATRDPTPEMIVHPRRSPALKPFKGSGAHALQHAAALGYHGTMSGTTGDGLKALFSFRTLQSAPWALFSIYPEDEAFGALRVREEQLVTAMLLLALVVGMAAWWASGRMLQPLEQLTARMHEAVDNPRAEVWAEKVPASEIARAVDAYNLLISARRKTEATLQRTESQQRNILAHAPHAFVSINADDRIVEWNRQAEILFGWTREDALGRDLAELILPFDQRAGHMDAMRQFSASGAGPMLNRRQESVALHRTGRLLAVDMMVAAAKTPDGWYANAFIQEVGERKAHDVAIHESQKRLRFIADNLPAMIVHADRDERVTFVNDHVQRVFGTEMGYLLGKKLGDLEKPVAYHRLQAQLADAWTGKTVTAKHEVMARGEKMFFETTFIPDLAQDGGIQGLYAMSFDVTEVNRASVRLEQLSRSDRLTRLANLNHFNEKLAEATARAKRSGAPIAVMSIDVDHFKKVNETLGHAAGDDVLREIAVRVVENVRTTDTVARLGDDQFAVVLEGLNNTEEADLVAEKVLTAVRVPVMVDGNPVRITVSIGVAVSYRAALTPADLTAHADQALYETKAGGKNSYTRWPASSPKTQPHHVRPATGGNFQGTGFGADS